VFFTGNTQLSINQFRCKLASVLSHYFTIDLVKIHLALDAMVGLGVRLGKAHVLELNNAVTDLF